MRTSDPAPRTSSFVPTALPSLQARFSLPRRVFTLCTLMGLLVLCAPAQAQDTSQRLDEFESTIKQLRARYVNPRLLENSYQIETRINEGRVYYLMKDYTRSAFVFMDLVQNSKLQSPAAKRDVLFYLADSLYLKGNNIGARRYFKQLLQQGSGEYYSDVVERLIEIASLVEDYDDIDALYQTARSSSTIDKNKLAYAYGKSLFQRNTPESTDRALTILEGVSLSSKNALQAMYFRGVALAKKASDQEAKTRFDRAKLLFEQIIESAKERGDDPHSKELIDLSYMAIGRIYYELGEYPEAIRSYQILGRKSPHFSQSLFEMTWTYIKSDELKTAQRNLDILLLLDPDGALAPEARLMRGDLLLRLNEYNNAIGTYEEIVTEYEPIKKKLGSILQREDGPKSYFDALVGRDVAALSTVDLPDVVEAWIREDGKMLQNLSVAQDLETARQDIQDSIEIIQELEDAINSRSKIDIFPELKDGWGRGLEVEAGLISTMRTIVNAQAKNTLSNANSQDAQRYAQKRKERDALFAAYDDVPKSRADLASREKKVVTRYEKLEVEIFKIGYTIDSMNAQLVALNKWLNDAESRNQKPSAKVEAELRANMKQQQETIETLERERLKLKRIVERAKAQTGINDEVAEQESDIKNRIKRVLMEEHKMLSSMKNTSNSTTQALQRIETIDRDLGGYMNDLDKIVVQKVAEIRLQLDQEKARVDSYVSNFESFSGRSESLAGSIALNNFRRVETKFNDLILKADVGIIDVAWKQKEDRTNRITDLFKLKGNDLKNLDKVFEDVRKSAK